MSSGAVEALMTRLCVRRHKSQELTLATLIRVAVCGHHIILALPEQDHVSFRSTLLQMAELYRNVST